MLYRLILPEWARKPGLAPVIEKELTDEELFSLNDKGYNCYYLPNSPSQLPQGKPVDGSMIDQFDWVFADMDLKSNVYTSKQQFIDSLAGFLPPTRVVDSGNGVHVYWLVKDLDAMSFLRIQRRLLRKFNTDEAIAKLYQLMRVPNTYNTKVEGAPVLCQELLLNLDNIYTCEDLDKALPPILPNDEAYCVQHYNKTHSVEDLASKLSDELPAKFGELLKNNNEVRSLWVGNTNDRSGSDFRLGHVMYANGFTKEEALTVLANTAKASTRGPAHRVSYAQGIIDKIWAFETKTFAPALSYSVKELLQKDDTALKGVRFLGPAYLDATEHGFRLGQVLGLVAGSGVGKTAMALNMFMDFVKNNPDYVHFFVPLEQPAREIALRWKAMCGEQTHLHDKVHVISNYGEDGSFRHLSFEEIKKYILDFQKTTKTKAGCVVIDHIGALRKKGAKAGENQDLMDICHTMKAFAVETNTFLVMQSQAPREKAGVGDLELNKDAAYGTVFFESYVDYLVTIWQPLKRCYSEESCPTITAYKFCKIRHKKAGFDKIHEDVCYKLMFDPNTERMRSLTEIEEKSFTFFLQKATNMRKVDRKTEVGVYKSLQWSKNHI